MTKRIKSYKYKTMHIVKWEPFGGLDGLGDSLFPQVPKLGWDLAIDLYEEKGRVIAKMSLPGVTADDLGIEIDGDMLTISGMREEEKETDEKDYYSKEIRRGSFSRSVRLPKAVDAKKAVALYADGVLKIEIPIVKGQKEKVVTVAVKK